MALVCSGPVSIGLTYLTRADNCQNGVAQPADGSGFSSFSPSLLLAMSDIGEISLSMV